MAAILAFHADGLLAQIDNPNIPHEQFNVGPPTVDQGYSLEHRPAPLNVPNLPVPIASRAIQAFRVLDFEHDFYYRIWLIPPEINFGYVPSPTSRQVVVWNAHRVPKELDSIAPAGDAGVSIDPDDSPSVYLPDEYRAYTVAASPSGPPNIAASFTFTFESGDEIRTLQVSGTRIVGWLFEANWAEPIVERAAWLTDVQVKRDGSEQRRQLRGGARLQYEFLVDARDDARRLLENTVHAFGGRLFSLPIWPDVRVTTAQLPIGSTSIDLGDDLAGTDFHIGGLGVLLIDAERFEAFTVEAIAGGVITLAAPLEQEWPAGTRVYPARAAYMLDDGRAYARLTRNYIRGLFRFETVDEATLAELQDETTYRDHPVLEHEPNWRAGPEIDYQRNMGTVDYQTAVPFRFDQAGTSLPAMRVSWSALDRPSVDYMRAWIWSRRGRQKAVWVPTWADDLRVLQNEGTVIVVANAGLVDTGVPHVHRRDLRIQLRDGTVHYRRIVSVQAVTAGESITLDADFGENLPAEAFERVSWMMLMRLDQDTIEIAWHTPAIAETVITLKGPRNDV